MTLLLSGWEATVLDRDNKKFAGHVNYLQTLFTLHAWLVPENLIRHAGRAARHDEISEQRLERAGFRHGRLSYQALLIRFNSWTTYRLSLFGIYVAFILS